MVVAGAGATTIRRVSDEELTTRAHLIVVGRQVESRSVWIGRMLMTRVTVAVDETLKGYVPAVTVTVDIPGGIDMNRRIPIGMSVAGAPTIHSGEHVVLFLSRGEGITAMAGSDEYGIVGFSQGKFSVVVDARGPHVVGTESGQGAKIPLGEFKAKIQKHISTQGLRERSSPRARPDAEVD
jgi:hypothetical protein